MSTTFNQHLFFEPVSSLLTKYFDSKKMGALLKINGLFIDCDYKVSLITSFFCRLLMAAVVKQKK